MQRHRTAVASAALVAGLLALASPAIAQTPVCEDAPPPITAVSAESREKGAPEPEETTASPLVTTFERAAIRFHAYPELSGEYRLNADNTLSIPVVGRIRVEGQTAACLERLLAKRASEIAKRDVFVTVEAVAYQPVFVAGAVMKPGAVQWSPGMTVLQALVLAGGRYRSAEAQNSMDPVRANKSFDDQKRALVTLSRLRSERADLPEIEPVPELVRLVGMDEAKTLVATQRSLFLSRRTAKENAVATLERALVVAREELQALRQRRASVDEQLRLRRAQQARLTDLRNKGIVIADRVLEEDFKLAQLDEKAIENAVALSRVGASIAGLERDMVALKAGRVSEIDAEIASQERIAAQSLIEVRAAQANGEFASSRNKQERYPLESVAIVRRTPGGQQRLSADDATPLMVGDTVILSVLNP
jgi:protein involved in polysaccharide export with SLBB domain